MMPALKPVVCVVDVLCVDVTGATVGVEFQTLGSRTTSGRCHHPRMTSLLLAPFFFNLMLNPSEVAGL